MPPPTLRRRSIVPALLVGSCLVSAATLLSAATPAPGVRNDPDRLVIAVVHWRDRAQLQQIAGHFQHVAVDAGTHTARVEASASDLALLRHMGVDAVIDDPSTQRMRRAEAAMAQRAGIARRHLSRDGTLTAAGLAATQAEAQAGIPGYACYRTVEETYATMDQLAHDKPGLASVVDIGPSWTYARSGGAQGYHLRVLRLGNSATDASLPDKPHMVVVAALHAREYTTAELATRFAQWLANGYGRNSEATWLLDNFRFDFILQANPDGRKKAESGLSWRKNTDSDNGSCSADAYGVDLNRNFSWRFDTVSGGSSGDACDSTYRGPHALSETETQDILDYVIGTKSADGSYSGGVLADRRTDTGMAPSTYRGMLLDLHSYLQLVLWPWATTTAPAPNATALRTLGRRMAYFNHYKPEQWIGLYAADGTITDTVYGTTGAPAYTIELGKEFFEDCATFESSTYPLNFAALKYAARNLRAPYLLPAGPDTTAIGTSASVIAPGQAFAVAAWVDDARFNQDYGTEPVQSIASAAATLDAAPWDAVAMALPMRANDAAFDSSREKVVVGIDTRGLGYGRHVVYVRGTDASGRPGTPSAIYFTVRPRVPHHDFDGDLHADLFWRNASTGQDVIWPGADSARKLPVTTQAGAGWTLVGQGDFDGDGRSDVFWRNTSSGANAVWRSGNAATPQTVAAVTDVAWKVAGVGDFDGDGRADVFWRNAATGANAIWRSANRATRMTMSALTNLDWQVGGVGDFDGDGHADVFWRNAANGDDMLWRGASRAASRTLRAVTDTGWRVAGVGDINNDGKDDVLWRHATSGHDAVWKSASDTSAQSLPSVSTAWQIASVGDFDADGFADVLWRNPTTGSNVIWKRADRARSMTISGVAGKSWSVVPGERQH